MSSSLQAVDVDAVQEAITVLDEAGFDVEAIGEVRGADSGVRADLTIRAPTRLAWWHREHGAGDAVDGGTGIETAPEDDDAPAEEVAAEASETWQTSTSSGTEFEIVDEEDDPADEDDDVLPEFEEALADDQGDAEDLPEVTDAGDPFHGEGEAVRVDASEDVEDSEAEKDEPDADDVDVPEAQQAHVLEWGRWGPPHSGTYHEDPECWVLHRSDSDREVATLPWPRGKLDEDDDWSSCGHCSTDDEGDTGDPDETADEEPADPDSEDTGEDGPEPTQEDTGEAHDEPHPEPDTEADQDDADEQTTADVEYWCGYCGVGPVPTQDRVRDHHDRDGHPGEPVVLTEDPAETDLLENGGPDVDDERDVRERVLEYLVERVRDGDRYVKPEDVAFAIDERGNDVFEVLDDVAGEERVVVDVRGVGVSGDKWRVDPAIPDGLTEADVHAVAESCETLDEAAENFEVDVQYAARVLEAHGCLDEVDDREVGDD